MHRVASSIGRRWRWPAVFVLALAIAPPFSPALTRAQADSGVETVTGTVTVSNPMLIRVLSEPFVNLTDLTAFVKRDLRMPLPSPVQITANLQGDLHDGASFRMDLPIRPEGATNDLGHAKGGAGVQVYALDFQDNASGDPFLDPIEMRGWPTALSSLKTAVGTNEVTGGEMVVWAADDRELFPAGFGPDGKLFTADDPVGPIAQGWTVVDLDKQPFGLIRTDTVDVPMIEGEAGLKDLSNLTYTAAFDRLIEELRTRYPFTKAKGLDWDVIAAEIRPEVVAAEQAHDQNAFNIALMHLAIAMHDGHVAVDPPANYVVDHFGGGVGVALAQNDDGAIVIRCVQAGSPAAKAGVAPGSILTEWNDGPAAAAATKVDQLFSESTVAGLQRQRLRLLPRMPVGASAAVSWRPPGADADKSATLTGVLDPYGLDKPCDLDLTDPATFPITAKMLPGNIGYIKIDTFADNLSMLTSAWEWSLRQLDQLGAQALIVDVRDNGGGVTRLASYFAGSFYDRTFTLDRRVFIDAAGAAVVSGIDQVEPAPVQWTKPVAVLIGSSCASACELFAAAMAHEPSHLIVGQSSTAGVEGGVFPWMMPGHIQFRAPLVGFQNAAGEVFLEGTGVAPNVKAPTTTASLILPPTDDVVLHAAETALQPLIAADAQQAANGGQNPAPKTRKDKTKGKGKAGAGANATPVATPAA
ncbi:MAG TPA: S41 family peptidase [Thermomicrobiales bacterium]|nr:S41 family peptidase [Thermomicrobiales bacterium]